MNELLINNLLIIALCAATVTALFLSVRRFTMLLESIETRMAWMQHDMHTRTDMISQMLPDEGEVAQPAKSKKAPVKRKKAPAKRKSKTASKRVTNRSKTAKPNGAIVEANQ